MLIISLLFLMTLFYEVIEYSFLSFLEEEWGVPFFFVFCGKDGLNFLEMGEPKLTGHSWY